MNDFLIGLVIFFCGFFCGTSILYTYIVVKLQKTTQVISEKLQNIDLPSIMAKGMPDSKQNLANFKTLLDRIKKQREDKKNE